MAIAISPSATASLTSGFFRAVSFRFLSLARSNRADHPRWYFGHRDYSRLRCGVAETQLRLSAAMFVRRRARPFLPVRLFGSEPVAVMPRLGDAAASPPP